MKARLLLVEDDAILGELLELHFTAQDYGVIRTASVADAFAQFGECLPDLALIDQQLPDGSGLDLLTQLLQQEPELMAIMMTARHDLELAIQAIQKGAYDFVYKPVQLEELSHLLERAIKQRHLQRTENAVRNDQQTEISTNAMIGQSKAMLGVSKEIALVANSDARILITGESGTGKELVARAIHSYSKREGLFLAVNCAAIVDNLLESELFGHEKGSFTGAVSRKLGKFELAANGTLFLDEIGELPLNLQAKLLRVLQEGYFERVGGSQQITTNARIIAATNRDLQTEVQNGRFREDLLYRVDVIQIHIPALRERREDIPLLIQGLMERLSRTLHRPPLRVTDAAMNVLTAYDWPGNVRELENTLTQAMLRTRAGVLTPDVLDLSQTQQTALPPQSEREPFRTVDGRYLRMDELEANYIQYILNETTGHKSRSAAIMGISRPALERKITKYSLHVPAKRSKD